MSMDDEDADLIAAKLASIQEAQEAGIPVLEDMDESLAFIKEQEAAELSISSGDVPNPPPPPSASSKAKKGSSSSAPKIVVPVWKEFVYVEFSFSAPEVKEGILVALDYNNFSEGAPMQRVGDKYFQTLALGCGKTYKYKFIVDGKDALDSDLPQDEEKKYNTIAISETGAQTNYSAAPVHTGPGPVTLDNLPISDLGTITPERLDQLKATFATTKIPIQSTERINSKVFTEKLLEFHRSVTWTIPANSFINHQAAEEAAKKKKEEEKKKAEEEAAKKAEEEAASKKAEEKKDESTEEKKDEVPSEEKKDAEATTEVKADDKKDEKPVEEKKDDKPAEPAASESASAEKKDDKPTEEKKDEKKEDEKKEEKPEEKKLEEENEPYPEFDDDEKEPEDAVPDVMVVRKSAKFTISFASVQIVDLVELDFGLVRTWFEGADSLKYNYTLTLEYNTAPRTWAKVWDRLPLEDIFSSSIVGRGKKSRMLQLSVAFRAQKLRFRLHVTKKSEAELDKIKNQSADLIRKFTYTEDFDKNGVLYWIGSCFGKSTYTNPQSTGDVTVTLSHSESSNRAVELVISHNLVRESYAFGGSAPVWFSVDLGPHLALSPDYYTLRHGYSYSDSILCDWELQGSNNNETWTTLHAQLEAPFNTGWGTKSWPVISGERFRYFRVLQKGNYAYGPGQGPNGSPYLYISGFELYGDLCSTTGVSPNIVSSFSVSTASLTPPGIEKPREFQFSHDGDTNGVLYCIGSTDSTEKWTNPARSGKVKTKVSGQSWNEADKWNCLARASDSNHSSSYWGGSLPLWFWVDLGSDWKICPNYYTLRHGNNYNENFMQNWEFQGSNDCEEWVKLHSGTDSPFSYAHQLVSWPVTECKEFYRYFRILQKSNSINGPGNESGPYMYIGGFEVYGTQQTSSSSGSQSPAEAQKKRSLNNIFLTNKDYHVQLIKTVQADATPLKLRLQCLETLDSIISRNTKVPVHILDAVDVKTFIRIFLTEGDKASSAQGGRWLQYLLSVNVGDDAFRKKLLDAILELLPTSVDTLQSTQNLDHFSNLLMSTWKADPALAARKCLQVLLDLGKRLQTGLDQNYQLLRSRFGLYEFALESDSFAEPPPKKKKKKTDNSNNYNSYDQQPEEAEEEEEDDSAEAEGETADTLEAQLVSVTLAFERCRAELRTALEHVSMGSLSAAPSPATIKDITKAQKSCITAQQQVHRCRTALQSKFPTHLALKNVSQSTQLDRYNVIAERLLVLITSYQHSEKKKNPTASSSLFSSEVVQEMFSLFCLHGSPVLRKSMTNFLQHNIDPNTSFAVQILRRLYTDERQAANELLPFEDIFQVIRELAMVDESSVVTNSRQLFALLAESTQGKKVDYQLSTWTLRLLGTILKSSLAAPHHYSRCRSCDAAPIRGVRYRCLQCVDYDLCAKCEASHSHDPMHTLVKIAKVLPLSPSLNDTKLAAKAKEPLCPTSLYAECLKDASLEEPKWPAVANVSHSIMCDFCGEGISGIRYKCINCNQYNLCAGCEGQTGSYNAMDSHYKGHLFAKIYHPLPPPSAGQNDAKTLVNVVLHPGLYPHPAKSEVPKKVESPTAVAEAPASTSAASSSSTTTTLSVTPASPSLSGAERTAATFGKAAPSPIMRASTGVPLARNSPSPNLSDALSAAEPEFSGHFLSILVNTMNYALQMQPNPSYELLLLASNCMRSLAYQYTPEDILTHVVRNSPQFMETISSVANMPYPTRVAINGLIHELCRASTFVNMPKDNAEATLKPLRAAFRSHISKLLASAIKGNSSDKATVPISAATPSSSKESPEVKPVSATRVQFFLGLMQGCADISDVIVEKKAPKVVADWRQASAPLKDFLPSTTTVYPIDQTLLSLIWNLLDDQNLSGTPLNGDAVHIITSCIALLHCADLSSVATASSFHKFIRNTFLSKAIVHRPFWRQLHSLLEKLVNHSTENANNIINNLFSLFTDALAQPATARDLLIVSTLALVKKKKSLLRPSTADLAKLISHCVSNMPEAKVLDSAQEDDHHVVEVDVLSLVLSIISADDFTSKKSDLLASENLSHNFIAPLVAWLTACDAWQASKKSGTSGPLQAIAIRKQLVAFLHELCDDHEGFAKRSLTALAESFKKNKLTSPKLVDLTIELMSNEALARHFIVDLEMGEVLQGELEAAEGSVTNDSTARPTMYDSTPVVPSTLFSGMTSLTSTCKLLEPANDVTAENTFRYGVPGSTSHQWCHRWSKEKDLLNWNNKGVDYLHTLSVVLQMPQPALIREIWFDYVRQYNVTPKPPPYVIIEMGTCQEDLSYVTTYEVKPQTLMNDSNTMVETFKIPFTPAQITQCVRLTFERPQGSDQMTLGALALLGTYNLFEDLTSKEPSSKARSNPSNNALNLLEHAFHYDAIRTFYGDYKGTTKLALQLLTMSTEETKNQVQTIALHLARHRVGLVSTLFAHFAKTGIPSTSSRFVGRLCAVADDQTADRVATLSKLVFSELDKGASSTSDRLVSLMNALSEALFVMLAAHRAISMTLTNEQLFALGDATLKSFGSSLTQEACIRILSCLIQADPTRYTALQDKFGPKTAADLTASSENNDLGNALTMLSLLAPLTNASAKALMDGPILKLLLNDINESKSSSAESAGTESTLSRAVNFVHAVSHHPIIKEWVGTNVLEVFMDILSERKFGATIQFAIQNALRTACNLSQANQDAVAGYLMKVFKVASTSSSGVSDAMLQLLEDMLNINDKAMLCMHSKNETSEELLLCESSSLATGNAVMALDPENCHGDMVLDEDELMVSGGTKSDYSWKTAIMANPAPNNGPVSWNVTIERSSGGNMMLGVSMKNHSHTIYVGGNSSVYKGWSFYGCTPGYKYHNGNAVEYGNGFNTGDVIGVHLDQMEGTLAFSHNGTELGVAFSDLPTDEPLYPAVSLCQNSDAVRLSGFSTSSISRSSGIDNKHPLYFQRSNRVTSIALSTTLSAVAEGLIGGRTDRKVVFTRFPKSTDDKESAAMKEELPHTTTLRELLDPTTEVLDVTFSLVPVIGDKKDAKKKGDKKADSKKDEKKDTEDEASKAEKEKEKAEVAARKAELDAKKKAEQTGVMKRFASQKGLEMLVAVLSQRLNPKSVAPAAGSESTPAVSTEVSTPATPAPGDAESVSTETTEKVEEKSVDDVVAKDTPSGLSGSTGDVGLDGMDVPIDLSNMDEADAAAIKAAMEGSDSESDVGGNLFGEEDDMGFEDFSAPAAAPAPSKKSDKKKKDEKQKKGFVSKATWAKWVALLSDCLIIDGVVDSFVQDEDCRAMLFAAIEASKSAPSAESSIEPLPQPSKAALEAPLIPLYKMLLSTLTSADAAKAATYREQLLKSGLLKNVFVEMMDLCDVMPVLPESEHFKTEATALKAERDEKAAAKKKKDAGTSYWAKGTGYGTNSDDKSDFNLTAYVRETVLTAKKVTHLLEVVAFMLTLDAAESAAELPAFQKEIHDIVLASALQPVLESYLRNDSLLEMSRSLALYKVVFRLSQILTTQESFLPLLVPDDSSSNIYTLMEHLQRIAALVQKMPATSEKRLKDSESKDEDKKSKPKSKKKKETKEDTPKEDGDVEAGDEPNEESEKLLATEIVKTFDMLKSKVHERREQAKAKAREAAASDTTISKVDKLIDLYCTTLRELQFGDMDMLEKGKDDEFSHHYKSRIKSDTAPGSKKMKRLVQELAVLSTSLPLHPDSSVFLRVDEQRIDVVKVLITGPDKTPYESGAFQFDMYLDSEYPKGSPKINLMTTGHGSVRFNPNLYNCGKVCLSLLGTWPGGANEEWNEETSTILQLMISIQSLIFVPEPYFNEPGYESTMNSDTGRTQSRQYNENIRMQTVRWAMVDQLKNPSPGFEEIIKTHFKLKKDIVLEQLDTWLAEFVAHAEPGSVKEFEKLVAEFTRLVNAL